MRSTAFLATSAFALTVGRITAPADSPPERSADVRAAADASNRFAFDLYAPASARHGRGVRGRGEEGAGAAATAVGMADGSGGRAEFRADRPFVFLIRDVKRGTVLFLGRVAKP